MAKKRKRQEELKEEREYKPPEFDRKEYVKTEVGVSKATMIAALFSVPLALAAVFVMPVGGAWGGLMAGLAGLGFIWFLLPHMNVDVKGFKPMAWAGILSTYFLLFLAIWVILCNPPFNDFASPEIREVQVSWDGGATWANVTATTGNLGVQIPPGSTVMVRAQVTDNVGVDVNTVMIARGTQSQISMTQTTNQVLFESEFQNVAQLEYFTITASDVNGHSSQYRFDVLP